MQRFVKKTPILEPFLERLFLLFFPNFPPIFKHKEPFFHRKKYININFFYVLFSLSLALLSFRNAMYKKSESRQLTKNNEKKISTTLVICLTYTGGHFFILSRPLLSEMMGHVT